MNEHSRDWESKLSLLAAGALDEPTAAQVADHLAACPICQRKMEGYGRVIRTMRALPRPEPGPGFSQRLLRGIHQDLTAPSSLWDRLWGPIALGWRRLALSGLAAALACMAVLLYSPPQLPEALSLIEEPASLAMSDLDEAELGDLLASLDLAMGAQLAEDVDLQEEEAEDIMGQISALTEEQLDALSDSLVLQEF